MKIIVTQEFDSVEAAQAFLAKVAGAPVQAATPAAANAATAPSGAATGAPAAPTTDKPARKPRSDAGKPRGPYKTTGEPAAAEPGVGGQVSAASSQPAAPATPTPSAPAQGGAPLTEPTGGTATGGALAAEGKPLTMEDARAGLKLINDAKGLGTPACIEHLKEFGVNKISDLPKEKYAAFIQAAKDKVAKHQAAAK